MSLPPTSGLQPPPTLFPNNDFAGPRRCFDKEDSVDWPMKKIKQTEGLTKAATSSVSPKSVVFALATLVMFLLLVIPIWNAIALLRDPVFTYVVGSGTTQCFLACCILLFIISYITLWILLDRIRPEMQTEQTLLMTSSIFLSALGIVLVCFGFPISQQALTASSDFMTNCKSIGGQTGPLYVAFEELQSLRVTPSCSKLASIEDCVGYKLYPKKTAAKVLKEMETEYLCSGICQGTNAQGEQVFPPTLFSKADYKVSCDGMASRRLRNFNAAVSGQSVREGCVIMGTALLISFGQLFAFCSSTGKTSQELSGKSYGATL